MLYRVIVETDAFDTARMYDRTKLFFTVFKRIRIRETLIPPPVEPAQAPMNISITRIHFDSSGQRSKSVVE